MCNVEKNFITVDINLTHFEHFVVILFWKDWKIYQTRQNSMDYLLVKTFFNSINKQ